MLVHYMKA